MKKSLSWVVLTVLLTGFLSFTACSKEKLEPVEFPPSLNAAIKASQQAEETFATTAMERITFLHRCSQTEPLKTFLSDNENVKIRIVEIEDAAIVLNKEGVAVSFVVRKDAYYGGEDKTYEYEVKADKEYLKTYFDGAKGRHILSKLSSLSNSDIFNAIARQFGMANPDF